MWATVLGRVNFVFLFISVVADVARRGVLNGGMLSTLHLGSALYNE